MDRYKKYLYGEYAMRYNRAIEKLSDEARLYLLRRMASHNLSLRQVLLELVIGISREAAAGSKEQETACSACFIPHLTSHSKVLHQ